MKINIQHISKLATLPIPQDKVSLLEQQLSETLTYIETLSTVNTKNVAETSQVTGLENITREDIAHPSLPQKEALQNKQDTINGFFQVKAILGDSLSS